MVDDGYGSNPSSVSIACLVRNTQTLLKTDLLVAVLVTAAKITISIITITTTSATITKSLVWSDVYCVVVEIVVSLRHSVT